MLQIIAILDQNVLLVLHIGNCTLWLSYKLDALGSSHTGSSGSVLGQDASESLYTVKL